MGGAGRRIKVGFLVSTPGWIALGVLAWLLVAIPVGVAVGRAIRLSDLRPPPDAEHPAVDPARRRS